MNRDRVEDFLVVIMFVIAVLMVCAGMVIP